MIFFNPPRSRRHDDHVLNTPMLWLASSLRSVGVEAIVRMPSGNNLDKDIVSVINAEQPHLVAISCKWWNTLYGALQVARTVRRHFPKLRIVVGGHTASSFPRELLGTGLIDVVLLGDCDDSILQLALDGTVSNGFTVTGYHPPCPPSGRLRPLDDVTLAPLHLLTDRPDAVPGYLWLGRGCNFPCFYCQENRETGKRILGRDGPRMRNVEAIRRDAMALKGRTQIILDYEHPSKQKTERFLSKLCSVLPDTFKSCYYFDWGLPNPKLVDALSRKFEQVAICLDIQVFDESHRQELSGRRLIKPFVPDEKIFRLLDHIEGLSNVHVDATGIVGMPFETAGKRENALAFIERVMNEYTCVRDWRFSPLHVIPGTPLAENERFHDLDVVRRSFEDFLSFTEESYKEEVDYYSTRRSFHPFGVYPAGQPSAIIDFVVEAEARLGSVRDRKRHIVVQRSGGDTRVEIGDPFTPLPTLFSTLNDPKIVGATPGRLTIKLAPRTWFHGSWSDYTSESGENSATKCGLAQNAGALERKFNTLLAAFTDVRFVPAAGQWGIISTQANAASTTETAGVL